MRIYEEADYAAVSRRAANLISAEVIRRPDCVLGLATGSSPIGTYRQLIAWHRQGDLSFKEVTTVNLDEYLCLAPNHSQSYRYFMQEEFFNHIDIKPENTYVPDGLAPDPIEECRKYDNLLRTLGGTDLQLLGIGHNGHIGFNEPGNEFVKSTHVVDLTPSTIEANSRFFPSPSDVPRKAITMGIGAIMSTRRVLVVVSGEDKAEIVRAAFMGPITPKVPASILQIHGDVVLVGDTAALSRLTETEVKACGF